MRLRCLWLAALAPCLAFAADPTAQEILAKAAATYRNVRGYECRVTTQTINGAGVASHHFILRFGGPGKYDLKDNDDANAIATLASANIPIDFDRIDSVATRAEVSRTELFTVHGKPTPIYVIHLESNQWPKGVYAMYRVDQKTFQIYKTIFYSPEATHITLYSMVRWNEPQPASLFEPRFVEGRGSASKSASLIGAPAPDFSLPDLRGKPVRLSELRGKVAVVDFWATWWPPCRAEMPALQQMQTELSGKGLVVLSLDVGEDAQKVAQFAREQSYNMPLLIGAEPDVSEEYFVEAYPTTFVVGRDGRITYRDLGGEDAGKLRAAVEAALAAK